MIQWIGRLQQPVEERQKRMRETLALWLQYGHSEAEIRRLVKAAALPLQPENRGV